MFISAPCECLVLRELMELSMSLNHHVGARNLN